MAQKLDEVTGKWYYYGYRKKNGKRVQYKKRGFATRKQANEAEFLFLAEQGVQMDIEWNTTVEELVEKYMIYSEKRTKDTTYIKDCSMMKMWVNAFGSREVDTLTRIELQKFIDECDSKYSKRYVEKIYYTGTKLFKFGIRHEYTSKNPLVNVERNLRPNEMEKEMKFWERDDFEKFIQNVDELMWKCFFSTLFYMGLRKGEAMALHWTDIDFKKKTMDINKTTSAKLRTKVNKCSTPKTKNSYRVITMPDVLITLLKQWKQVENSYPYFDEKNSFVFGNQLPLAEETIRRNFRRYIDKTNEHYPKEEQIEYIRIHDLRHSHASYLINNMTAGFTDFDVAKRLGDTVATLHNTYAHWFKRKDENIVNFMNNDNQKQEQTNQNDLEQLASLLKKLSGNINNAYVN